MSEAASRRDRERHRARRLLVLLTSLNRGGKETRAVDVIRGLDRDRLEPSVGILHSGTLVPELGETLARERLARFRGDPLAVLRVAALLRAERPDVVWCLGADLVASLALSICRVIGVPVVVSFHGARKPGEELIGKAVRPLIRFAARAIAVCDAIKQELVTEGFPASKIVVQLNGVDTSTYRPSRGARASRSDLLGIEDDAPVIGHVGSLLPIKEQHVLLEAFAKVRRELPRTRLVMIGRGPLKKELEARAERLGVREGLLMLGERVDVPQLLPCFDLLMMSSRAEGCPNAALEAMACGVPVVATRAGGTPEVVRDGETGFLVAVGDAAALARHASAILGDPAIGRRLGERARQRIEKHFDLRRMVAERTNLLEVVAGS